MKLKDWLNYNKYYFVDGDLRLLLKSVFAQSYPLACDEDIDPGDFEYLEAIRSLYQQGIPMAYLLDKEEFFGLEFTIDSRVLIPRKETELIVENALKVIKKSECRDVLDLGCGSGNIAIAIKKALPFVRMNASDKSPDAIMVARHNATRHETDITFSCCDLLQGFKDECFDMVISNPPYVAAQEITEMLRFEPRMALEADNNGFSVIEKLLRTAPRCVRAGGYVVFEMGYNHRELVYNIVCETGVYQIQEWIRDYDGNWRGAVLQVKNQ